MIQRLALFGVGLIGGSFALALKQAGAVGEVVGVDRNPAVLERALGLGIIDRCTPDAGDALCGSDFVLVSAPVLQSASIFSMLAAALGPDTVVSDTGSTKCSVIAAARAALGPKIGQFVPAHPLAGSAHHGPDAAQADLFAGKKVVVTPLAENPPDSVVRVRAAWIACGASVIDLEALEHDRALAAVSHLPHLLAYSLVAQVAQATDGALQMTLAGTGFRDFTRIAASSPEMWRDIALANREPLLLQLDTYLARLSRLRADLAAARGTELETLFTIACNARSQWERDR